MTFAYDVESLLATSATDVGLTVAYNGATVSAPHIVTLATKSIGRGDITTAMFDAGRSITFRSSAAIVAVLEPHESGSASRLHLTRDGDTDTMLVRPTLVRKGDTAMCRLLVDGRPDVVVDSPLIDTALVSREERAQRSARTRRFSSFGVFVVVVGVSVLVWQTVPAETAFGQLALGMTTGAVLMTLWTAVSSVLRASAEADRDAPSALL